MSQIQDDHEFGNEVTETQGSTPNSFFNRYSKFFKIAAVVAFFYSVGKLLTRNYGAFGKLMSVTQILITVAVTGFVLYIISRDLFGTVITVNRRDLTAKFKLIQDTPGTMFLMFMYYLADWGVTGFRDYEAFKKKLAANTSPLVRKDVFAVFASLCCYQFGIVNLLFTFTFWWLTMKQFDVDPEAATHVTSCEILIGVVFAVFLVVKFPLIYILYIAFTLTWIMMHMDRSYAFITLQASKMIVFIASLLIPHLLAPSLHRLLHF